MPHIRTSLRAFLAGAALRLAQGQPGSAAGFDGAIKNNALALNAAGTVAAVSNSEETSINLDVDGKELDPITVNGGGNTTINIKQ